MTHRHQLTTASQAAEFCMAGQALFTLVSKRTGTRFTYKLDRRENLQGGKVLTFAGLLSGPDNNSDYTYLGVVDNRGIRRTKASRITSDAPSMVAINWFLSNIARGRLPDTVEVWHEGRCGRCGRRLTVPESIERGIGPHCATRLI